MSTFQTIVEANLGYYHPWSQDTYLSQINEDDSEGVCSGVCSEWLRMRRFAVKAGLYPRQTFKDHMVTDGAKKNVLKIQQAHQKAIEENQGGLPQIIVAAKMAAILNPLKEEGMKLMGTTVTNDAGTMTSFITSEKAFYLIGLHGPGGGHALAVHNIGGSGAKIVLFDPNEGEGAWNDQYKEAHFTQSLYRILQAIYSDVKNFFIVARLGS